MYQPLSIFDIFKIGVGPSSSHTLGPWKAALDFIGKIEHKNFNRLEIELFGSLSKTGIGHCTDIAVVMGLSGYQPDKIDTKIIPTFIAELRNSHSLEVTGRDIVFSIKDNIIFNHTTKMGHPNTVIFRAFEDINLVVEEKYYSIGGGFIEQESINQTENPNESLSLPYPITFATELLAYTDALNCSISDVVTLNERAFKSEEEINKCLQRIIDTMLDGIYRGTTTEGILPGGLLVKRRAKKLATVLMNNQSFKNIEEWKKIICHSPHNFATINNWVSCFALAINEENADLGRVVTSPTNGAAGVIPAVMFYHYFFNQENKSFEALHQFLKVAGEIGCLFKKNATISAAVGGCQAEIGVSSAMAAGGLTEIMGGTPQQVLMAAEIAMEHHLGLTCDPIGGLVQIPCIERNTMGAIKAITASLLALASDPNDAKVHLDVVIRTMWETAKEMNDKYKETSEGGLAFQIPVTIPEC